MTEREEMQMRLSFIKWSINGNYGKYVEREFTRSQALFAESRFIRLILQHTETNTIGI